MPFDLQDDKTHLSFTAQNDFTFIFVLHPSQWTNRERSALTIYGSPRNFNGTQNYSAKAAEIKGKIDSITQGLEQAESKGGNGLELAFKSRNQSLVIDLGFPRFRNVLSAQVQQSLAELFKLTEMPAEEHQELMALISHNNASPTVLDYLFHHGQIEAFGNLIEQGDFGFPPHQWFLLAEKLRAHDQPYLALCAYLKSCTDSQKLKHAGLDQEWIDCAKYAGMRALILELLDQVQAVDDKLIKLLEGYFSQAFDNEIFFDIAELLYNKGQMRAAEHFYTKLAKQGYGNGSYGLLTIGGGSIIARHLYQYCQGALTGELTAKLKPLFDEISAKYQVSAFDTKGLIRQLLFTRLDLSDNSADRYESVDEITKALAEDLFGNLTNLFRFEVLGVFDTHKRNQEIRNTASWRVSEILDSSMESKRQQAPDTHFWRTRFVVSLEVAMEIDDLELFKENLMIYLKKFGVQSHWAEKLVEPVTELPNCLTSFLVGFEIALEHFKLSNKPLVQVSPLSINTSRFEYAGEVKQQGSESGSEKEWTVVDENEKQISTPSPS